MKNSRRSSQPSAIKKAARDTVRVRSRASGRPAAMPPRMATSFVMRSPGSSLSEEVRELRALRTKPRRLSGRRDASASARSRAPARKLSAPAISSGSRCSRLLSSKMTRETISPASASTTARISTDERVTASHRGRRRCRRRSSAGGRISRASTHAMMKGSTQPIR